LNEKLTLQVPIAIDYALCLRQVTQSPFIAGQLAANLDARSA
jgi:hypothetical protein